MYVWQSAWTPDVRSALTTVPGVEPIVLRAEVGETVREVSVPAIGPHGVVVRADHFAPAVLARAAELAVRVAREPDVVELQLDVDVPTSQLGAYTDWVATISAAVDVPVCVTGLPDWLHSPALPGLLAAVDGWVLQVHAPPAHDADPVLWPDSERAIAAADALGVPFRVALPTYGVGEVLDTEGAVQGVVGEGVRFDGPEAWADPAAVAALVRSLDVSRYPTFGGVIWFRLPVAGDRWTWSAETFAAVRAGRAPEAELAVEVTGPDVRVRNVGEGDGVAPAVVVEGDILGFDAVGGWRGERTATGVVFDPPARPVPAHAVVPVGWVRGEVRTTTFAAESAP